MKVDVHASIVVHSYNHFCLYFAFYLYMLPIQHRTYTRHTKDYDYEVWTMIRLFCFSYYTNNLLGVISWSYELYYLLTSLLLRVSCIYTHCIHRITLKYNIYIRYFDVPSLYCTCREKPEEKTSKEKLLRFAALFNGLLLTYIYQNSVWNGFVCKQYKVSLFSSLTITTKQVKWLNIAPSMYISNTQ